MKPDRNSGGPLYRSAARSIGFVRLARVLSTVGCLLTGAAWGQEPLPCGVPVARHLRPGAIDSFQLTLAAGATALVEVTDTSGTIGLMKLRVPGQDGTCRGELTLVGPGSFIIHASDCFGTDSGNYTITQHVVSQAHSNCGIDLACGATPDGTGFSVPGQVDAYTFAGKQDNKVALALTDLTGIFGRLRVRLFAPNGVLVAGTDSCAGVLKVVLPVTGPYTALVSPCGVPKTGPYRITFHSPWCPAGPVITHFGLASADENSFNPTNVDSQGRSVYELAFGSGFMLVVEAHPGGDGSGVGVDAFHSDAADPTVLPDLQMLASRSLGNGSAAVCDKTYPHIGGIPGFFPPEFLPTQTVADAINDLGCRFDDGTGSPLARSSPLDACTRSDQGFGYGFVDRTSTAQFCTLVNSGWPFPSGDTILVARIRDATGILGAARQIVVRVGAAGTPSATPTPTSTLTPIPTATAPPPPSFTATPAATPTATGTATITSTATTRPTPSVRPCVGDCGGSGVVSIDKLLQCVNIALHDSALDACNQCDANGDGKVTIDELLQAVINALNGCSATTAAGFIAPMVAAAGR